MSFKRGDRVVYLNFFGDKIVETSWHGTVADIGVYGSVFVDWDDDEYTPMRNQEPGVLRILDKETLDLELEAALNQVTAAFNHLRELGYRVWWDELSFFVGENYEDDAFLVYRDRKNNEWSWEQK